MRYEGVITVVCRRGLWVSKTQIHELMADQEAQKMNYSLRTILTKKQIIKILW